MVGIGNACFEARAAEKAHIIAGPKFGKLKGHRLVIDKALYGLRTSGQRWHDRFAECMRMEGFNACLSEPDIWMRQNGDMYEYVAVYVNEFAFAVKTHIHL